MSNADTQCVRFYKNYRNYDFMHCCYNRSEIPTKNAVYYNLTSKITINTTTWRPMKIFIFVFRTPNGIRRIRSSKKRYREYRYDWYNAGNVGT